MTRVSCPRDIFSVYNDIMKRFLYGAANVNHSRVLVNCAASARRHTNDCGVPGPLDFTEPFQDKCAVHFCSV